MWPEKGSMPGRESLKPKRSLKLIETPLSRRRETTAPKAPAKPSARALSAASAPLECRLFRVSAAAMPLGNLSCSMFIIWRFIGMAMNTPRAARKTVQRVSTVHDIWWPVIIR